MRHSSNGHGNGFDQLILGNEGANLGAGAKCREEPFSLLFRW